MTGKKQHLTMFLYYFLLKTAEIIILWFDSPRNNHSFTCLDFEWSWPSSKRKALHNFVIISVSVFEVSKRKHHPALVHRPWNELELRPANYSLMLLLILLVLSNVENRNKERRQKKCFFAHFLASPRKGFTKTFWPHFWPPFYCLYPKPQHSTRCFFSFSPTT